MKLRIVTWNCNMGLHQKFERLLALQPDVAVIQECAGPEANEARSWRPLCSDQDWIGFNPHKGLGIFAFSPYRLRRDPSYSAHHSLYLPVRIEGPYRLNLLGAWMANARTIEPGTSNDPRAAVRYYHSFLAAGTAVVAGDFNLLPQQVTRRPPGGRSLAELLAEVGLQDADLVPVEDGGAGSLRPTYFHRRRPREAFVVDYLFVPRAGAVRLSRFDVADPQEWLPWSDHVPLVAELEV